MLRRVNGEEVVGDGVRVLPLRVLAASESINLEGFAAEGKLIRRLWRKEDAGARGESEKVRP
ncbi:MAG: hypothetical protein QOE47_157 [Pyrinomonadaceae bacterium]|jgi:hypothetical protein|nr:hypothetical protein [Pyrinomonadaceae bacterium]MDX6272043.1 hypothetical protein [Acidobacteriota bacterium]